MTFFPGLNSVLFHKDRHVSPSVVRLKRPCGWAVPLKFLKILLFLVGSFSLAFSVVGCKGSGGDAEGSKGGLPATAASTGSLSGTVADGLAMANAKVSIQSADGALLTVGTTDAKGGFSGFSIPEGFSFPVMLSVDRAGDGGSIRAIVAAAPGAGLDGIANINPITQSMASNALGSSGVLKGLDVSNGANGFASKSKKLIQDIFGDAIDYESFSSKSFQARSETDSTSGGLADTLIDTIAQMDSSRKPEELLASAANPEDSSMSGSLLQSPSFQAKLTGELVAQGRSAQSAQAVIQTGVSTTSANTASLLVNTETLGTAFEDVSKSATAKLTGSNSSNKIALASILGAAANVVSEMIQSSGTTSGASLSSLITNSMTVAKGPLINIASQNQSGSDMNLILSASGSQISKLMANSTTNLSKAGVDTLSLGTQVENVGQIISSALSQQFTQSNNSKNNVNNDKKKIIADKMAEGVADSLSSYLDDLSKVSGSLSVVEQKSLDDRKTKAKNTALNVSSALDRALVTLTTDANSTSLDNHALDKLASTMVNAAVGELKGGYDLSVTPGQMSDKAANVANNLASLTVQTAAAMVAESGKLDSSQKAVVMDTVAKQALQEIRSAKLDLTQSTPPASADNVVKNMAGVVGSSLISEVTASTTKRQDVNLQVMASSAVSQSTAAMKNGTSLTESIQDMTSLKKSAANTIGSSMISVEAAFKALESKGVNLGQVSGGMVDSGLAGDAVYTVFTQVSTTLSSGNQSLKSSAADLAKVASLSAKSTLDRGGSMADVQNAISKPLAAMVTISEKGSNALGDDVRSQLQSSAAAISQTATYMAQSNMSAAQVAESFANISAVLATESNTNVAQGLVDTVKNSTNTPSSGAISLDSLGKNLDNTKKEELPKTKDEVIKKAEEILVDGDGDGIADGLDNCPVMANANQADVDRNGIGDACENKLPNPVIQAVGSVAPHQSLILDGSASFDPEGKPLTFQWSVVSSPGASAWILEQANTAKPTMTFLEVGTYNLLLTVNDGEKSRGTSLDILVSLASVDQFSSSSANYRLLANGFYSGASTQSANYIQTVGQTNMAWPPGKTMVSGSYSTSTGQRP